MEDASSSSPPADIRCCRLHGIAKSHVDDSILGLLLTYIDANYVTLRCAAGVESSTDIKDRWIDQIRETVQQLHDSGVVWGDVKPDNVLMDANDVPWLIDFGGSYTGG